VASLLLLFIAVFGVVHMDTGLRSGDKAFMSLLAQVDVGVMAVIGGVVFARLTKQWKNMAAYVVAVAAANIPFIALVYLNVSQGLAFMLALAVALALYILIILALTRILTRPYGLVIVIILGCAVLVPAVKVNLYYARNGAAILKHREYAAQGKAVQQISYKVYGPKAGSGWSIQRAYPNCSKESTGLTLNGYDRFALYESATLDTFGPNASACSLRSGNTKNTGSLPQPTVTTPRGRPVYITRMSGSMDYASSKIGGTYLTVIDIDRTDHDAEHYVQFFDSLEEIPSTRLQQLIQNRAL